MTRRYKSQELTRVSSIEDAIAHPTRDNLLGLRSGRDSYSKSKLFELRSSAGDKPEIDETELSDSDKAAAYRWVLRGLPAELAVKKIVYGIESAERRSNSRFAIGFDEEDEEARDWLDEAKERQAEVRRENNKPKIVKQQHQDEEIVTYLAGAKHYDTSKVVVGPLELEWEPTNPHDQNAIKIYQRDVHIGYIPKDIAEKICLGSSARLTAIGYPWTVIVKPPLFVLPKLLVGLN